MGREDRAGGDERSFIVRNVRRRTLSKSRQIKGFSLSTRVLSFEIKVAKSKRNGNAIPGSPGPGDGEYFKLAV
jgi:hypothetical protein